MKILIFANKYYPIKSANDLCVHNIISCVSNANFYILSFGDNDNKVNIENCRLSIICDKFIKRNIGNRYLKFLLELPFRILGLFYRPLINNRIVY